jgi:hypothetical protein
MRRKRFGIKISGLLHGCPSIWKSESGKRNGVGKKALE